MVIEPSRAATTSGALTYTWRWILGAAWFGIIVGFSVVSRSSRELGLPTWWLGPSSDPQPYPLIALPFLVPAAIVALTFTRIRWTSWAALGAGAVLLCVGLGDVLGDYPRLGVVEIALAAAGTMVAAVSLTGRVRVRPHQLDPPGEQDDGQLGAEPGATFQEDDQIAGR